jgi:hypothetical protein
MPAASISGAPYGRARSGRTIVMFPSMRISSRSSLAGKTSSMTITGV